MSMEICTFVSDIDDSLIPAWLERMKSVGMDCDIYPDFSFFAHSGFLPFKLTLTCSDNPLLSRQAYLTGFEFYISPFNLSEQIRQFKPQQSLLDKLLGKGKPRVYFVDENIDRRLEPCRYCLSFVWGSGDIFQLRMATVSAAIIAELTGGVCSFIADDIWYDNQNLVEDCIKEAESYEAAFKNRDIKLYPFNGWK